MTDDTTDVDRRTTQMKTEMAKTFDEYEAEYREMGPGVVYEDDQCVIIADRNGHEHGEWSEEFDVDTVEFARMMNDLAADVMGEEEAHSWNVSCDLVVFDRLED